MAQFIEIKSAHNNRAVIINVAQIAYVAVYESKTRVTLNVFTFCDGQGEGDYIDTLSSFEEVKKAISSKEVIATVA